MTGLEFAQFAESQCGKGASEFRSNMGLGKNSAWSAAFVSSCAKKCDVSGSVIPKVTTCQDLADKGVSKKYVSNPGTLVSSTASSVVPQPGDVALFVWSSKSEERADSVGVVRSYDPSTDTVEVVVGDCGSTGSNNSKVRMVTYSKSFSCIKGYFRPSWDSE